MQTGFIRLRLKTLAMPALSFGTMLRAMQQVYAAAAIQPRLVSTESLDLPKLADLQVGDCMSGCTPDQVQLYAHRGSAFPNDVVVFICRILIPPYDGCSTHPEGSPSLALQRDVDEWALAHEVGHLLGLTHVDDDDRLMTGNGTANITNPPPDLIASEIAIMRQSPLVSIPTQQSAQVRAILENHQPFEQKLTSLADGSERELAVLAAGSEPRIASKAIYLASLMSEGRGASIVQSALRHPSESVRAVASAAVANLATHYRTRSQDGAGKRRTSDRKRAKRRPSRSKRAKEREL